VQVDARLVAGSLGAPSFDPVLGTLEALQQSGGLTSIRDSELRRALAAFPSTLRDAQDIETVLRNIVIGRYRNVLHSSGNVVAAELLEAGEEMVELRFTRELVNVLAERVARSTVVIRELNAVGEEIASMLELLERELSG
jgi:hypothetical protein